VWVDGYYDYDRPSYPLRYVLNTGDQTLIDAESQDYIGFSFHRNILEDIDGRQTTFWTLERNNYHYFYSQQRLFFFQLTFSLSPGYTKYTQYYEFLDPALVRNLNSTSITNISNKTKTEEQTNNILFNIFYIFSQLGGLYSFLA